MKSFLFCSLFFIASLLLSCNNEADTTSGSTGSGKRQQEMLDINRQIIKGIETGDSALLQKYISDDAIDHGGGPDGQDLKGKEVAIMLASLHLDIDDLKMKIEQMAANNDHLFSLVHMTGTTNKPMWGMPPNTKIDSRSVDVLRIKDGKVVEHWGYANAAEIMRMMEDTEPQEQANRPDTSQR